MELAENALANNSAFALEEIIIEPSSAMSGRKELSSKLLFMCLASVKEARLPLGHEKIFSRMCSLNCSLALLNVLLHLLRASISASSVRVAERR